MSPPAPPDPVGEHGYAALFQAHFAGLTRLSALLGADDPEDLTQEAFVRLYRRRALLRDPNAALGYLRATVCNLTRSRLRHLGVVRRQPAERVRDVDSAEHDVIVAENRREVLRALRLLPPRQREALVLRYWLGMSEAAMAEVMGVSRGTVKAHVSRGIDALGQRMEERP